MSFPTVNGWKILFHPQFIDQYQALVDAVKAERAKNAKTYLTSKAAKLLAAVNKLIFDTIPGNPADPNFRQGSALGKGGTDWFRAKFFQQFRLFFRYSSKEKIIIFAWFNDEDTLRAYESETEGQPREARDTNR